MISSSIKIRFINRGEQIIYEDETHYVECQFTYIHGNRFYTDSVIQCNKASARLTPEDRIIIVERVIKWLKRSRTMLIVVIDEADECRRDFEKIVSTIKKKIMIEYDSEEKRKQNRSKFMEGISS